MHLTHSADALGSLTGSDDHLGRSPGMLHAGQGFGRAIADRGPD